MHKSNKRGERERKKEAKSDNNIGPHNKNEY